MQDEQLREQLADWARSADRLPLPDIGGLRARVRHRRLRVGGAVAGIAVVTAIIAVVATLPATPTMQPGTGPVAWYPAGPPPPPDAGPAAAPYFITLLDRVLPQDSPDGSVVVTDWRTGAQIAKVRPPAHGGAFVGVAAAGDDRTFVLEEDRDNQPTAFYELRLRTDGRPLTLTRLAIPESTMAGARSAASAGPLFDPVLSAGVPPIGLSNSFAMSPDGGKLAVAVAVGDRAAIDVVSLATGSVREWSGPGGAQAAEAIELGWAGNRYLTFTWPMKTIILRLLDTASDSNLLASRTVAGSFKNLYGTANASLYHYTISPDGSALFAEYIGPLRVGSNVGLAKVAIFQISVRTGKPVREILPPVRLATRGPLCQVLWSDPSGRRVAATCGSIDESGLEQGIVSDGKFQRLTLNLPGNDVFDYAQDQFLAW